MIYEAKNFEHLLGLAGFSDIALNTHFTLYQGYINNTNKLLDKLSSLPTDSPEFAELKRRFGWEFNGMRLHEYYFGSLTKTPTPLDPASPLHQQIIKDFGTYAAWEADFKATAMTRGIGWAILYFDQQGNRLINTFVNEHDLGHLASCQLILNLDVFEHAFMLDYGTNRADYITAWVSAIDWLAVGERFTV